MPDSKNKVIDDSDILPSGNLPLHEQILDLIFNLKPLENYSSMIYGLDTFVPNNKLEKVLLLGLLKRSVIIFGTREKPLEQQRYTNVDELVPLSSELILSLVKLNQHDLLLKFIESIVSFSNYNSNILLQYALLLENMGLHKLALEYLLLVSEVMQVPYLNFTIIHTYYVHLNDFDSGIDWCHKTLKLKYVLSNSLLKSKCHMYLGIGLYMKCLKNKGLQCSSWGSAFDNHSLQETREAQNSVMDVDLPEHYYHVKPHDIVLSNSELSITSFLSKESLSVLSYTCNSSLLEQSIAHVRKALHHDRDNPLLHYYLALILAQSGNTVEAKLHIKQSLDLHAEYLPSLHLLVLLESTWNIPRAETLLLSTIREYPDNVQLHMTHAHINIKNENFVEAIDNLKEALVVWERVYCDARHLYNDTDSGQFSVDYKDKWDLYNLLGKTSECPCPPDTSNLSSDVHSTAVHTDSKHVTFVPSKENLPCNCVSQEEEELYDETPKEDSAVDIFLSCFINKLRIAKINHEELPDKLCLLVDIWSEFAQIYLRLKSLQDFVQCLSELLHICDVTAAHVGSIVSQPEQVPALVLSKHCVEILFCLGLYFEDKSDLLRAKFCFDNVLSISHHHVESLYHRGSIQKALGHLNDALYTVHTCLQLSDVGSYKGKLYALMGEIFGELEEHEKACVCSEVALQFDENMPVCSYDIIPFVWQ